LLVSQNPETMALDFGTNGLYSYKVIDTYQPTTEIETGDPDLSLLSYLNCLKNSFLNYQSKVENTNFLTTFNYLTFHTPFTNMVIKTHRKMMRKYTKLPPKKVKLNFKRQVHPSLQYCVQVGNVYSTTLYLTLCGLIDSDD